MLTSVCCWRVVCCPSLCQRLSILVPEKTWWVSTDWPTSSSVTDCAGTALCAGATVTTRSRRHRWWTCPHHRPTVFYTHKMTVRIVCVLFVFCTRNMTVTVVSVLFVCVLHTQHDGENCLYSVHTAWPLKLSVLCAHSMTVKIVCVLHTQHDR